MRPSPTQHAPVRSFTAISTRSRRGVTSNVRVIVPCRNSFVTEQDPQDQGEDRRRRSRCSRTMPELVVGLELRSPLGAPTDVRPPLTSPARATSGDERSPRSTRSVFGASGARLRESCVMRRAPPGRPSARGRPPRASPARSSARAGRRRSRPRSRRRAPAAHRRRAPRRSSARTSSPACDEHLREPPGVRARGPVVAPAAIASTSAHRRLPDEAAAVDDHDLVDGLRDLGEDVARDEDRPAPRRERAQEVAEPADPLRVETVRRLVEHEHLGVAEERRREARAAAACRASSPSRAACPRPSCRRASRTSSTRERGMPAATRQHAEVIPPRPTRVRVEGLEQRPDALRPAGRARGYGRPQHGRPAGRRMHEAEDRRAASSTCPRRSAPGSPVIVPGGTVNERSSTASVFPYRFVRCSTSIMRSLEHASTYTVRSRGPSNSQKKIPCQVPSASEPSSRSGTTTLGPISDARTWVGAFCSCGSTCSHGQPSSTIRSSAASWSRATAGSACSLIVTPAVVCGT